MRLRQRRWLLLALVVFAFVLRLAAVVALRDMRQGPTMERGTDGVEYNAAALSLARGEGYCTDPGRPTAFRAPGFPLVLAAIYVAAPGYYPAAYVLFCALGALTCLLTFLAAHELAGAKLAWIAAAACAVYPPNIYTATVFASETLFMPLIALALWQFAAHLRTGAWSCAAVAGLATGGAALTRAFALLVIPLLLLVLLWADREDLRTALRPIALFVLAAMMVILPWTARNYGLYNRLVLVASNGGSTFWGGNNDWAISDVRNYGNWISPRSLPGWHEGMSDGEQWQRGMEWIRAHPLAATGLAAAKYVRMWLPDFDSRNRKYVLLQVFGSTPFIMLMLLGQMLTIRSKTYWSPAWLALHAIGLATALTGVIFWGSPRFRDASSPLLMIYAAVTIECGFGLVCRRCSPSRQRAAAVNA